MIQFTDAFVTPVVWAVCQQASHTNSTLALRINQQPFMSYYSKTYERRLADAKRIDQEEKMLREAGTSRLDEDHKMCLAHSRGKLYVRAQERREK
jgi:hypothetical protein